ncbi:biotin/lipoate A/B protein ligase family protein [Lentimicrobium sp. S6]|uniref:lipoate--protein ligase family protein n=1 Tax=Lentimicrobium sp. S6 TaxID=2735872 RepID=UPI001555D078|nr:biotin/lipoate A/B protein ligase family protein [Lentimicrobium sp. S6]NPD48220.1 lipoate--protein ligase family protein [Lentimicrobium sp. S6]
MLIIQRESTDPFFNIATEEFLVKTLEEPCFMLWQNTPSVIMGKHQNPLKEVNIAFLNQKQIPIIRRISGGGTVYHDLGNLNYSFIDMGKADSLVNFAKYSQPILDLLQSLEVDAKLVGKSDLKINDRKFSGNASHVYRNKVLHHGTLLFNSNLKVLNESIKINKNNITDKAVNSNRSVVGNISDYLSTPMTISDFKSKLFQHIQNIFPEAKVTNLNKTQISEIQRLADEKYKTWEWNFGYGPKYTIKSNYKIQDKDSDFQIVIAKGFIQSITCSSPLNSIWEEAINSMIGLQHQEEIIKQHLYDNGLGHVKNSILEVLF